MPRGLVLSGCRNGYGLTVAEIFFRTIKNELIHPWQYHTRQEARKEIFGYLEVFRNQQRCHSTLGYRTPAEREGSATTT